MSQDLQFRTRFAVDDHALSSLHTRAFSFPDEPTAVVVHPWSARLSRHSLVWVGAFADKRLVGFAHAPWDGGTHAFLLDVIVDPALRRRGIGQQLVEILIGEVRRSGCEWLHVDYLPHLEEFYRGCGFRPSSAGVLQLS